MKNTIMINNNYKINTKIYPQNKMYIYFQTKKRVKNQYLRKKQVKK